MALNNKFLNAVNNVYGKIDKKAVAQKMLQGTVSVGEAVVNILQATGIAGFRFHVPETEQIKLENEITDHYVETNVAIQDHIVQKPITITLVGYVGDYFYSNHKIQDLLAVIVSTAKVVKEFLPNFTDKVQQVKADKYRNTFGQTDKLSAKETFQIFKEDLNDVDIFAIMQSLFKFRSAQTRAYLFFEALWKSRVLFTVETSWKRFDNMAIQSIQATRDKNADITEFSVTFKQLSFAATLTETKEQYANRMEQQRAKITNKGLHEGRYLSISSLELENPLLETGVA